MPKIRSKKLIDKKLKLYEAVKDRYKKGDETMAELAHFFGRSTAWVYKVINNKYLTK